MRFSAWVTLMALAALPVSAEEATFQVLHRQDEIFVSARLDGVKAEEILSALEEGLESEITFQMRVYEKAMGFFSFFGDKLVGQDAPSFRANLDRLTNNYIIRPLGGEETLYTDKSTFLAHFLQLNDYSLRAFKPQKGKEYYLLSRIRLVPARLTGPLTIISLFFRTGHTTEWKEMTLVTGESG